MNERITTFFLLLLGMGFSAFILVHLIMIQVYGAVTIYEPNPVILIQEIVTLSVIVLFYVRELRRITR